MSWADDTEDWNSYLNSQGKPTAAQLQDWRAEKKEWGVSGAHRWEEPAPQSSAAREALKTILRTGKRSHFRKLAIVCRKNHTIAEIYQTGAGLVLVGSGPLGTVESEAAGGVLESHYDPDYGHVGDTEWSATWEQRRRLNRETRVVCLVDQLRRQESGWRVATLQCRCTTAELYADDIDWHLAARKRRVVYESRAQRT